MSLELVCPAGTPAALRDLLQKDPAKLHGFMELDEPNFTFRNTPCNFLSGTKALAEEAVREIGQCYVWRARMAFNGSDEPCNLLTRLQQQAVVYDYVNSISNVEDFVKAALDLWEVRAPFGTYNITNPGIITGGELVEALQRVVKSLRVKLSPPDEDPARYGSPAPQSNCVLDVAKLLKTGVRIRPVADALKDSLERMRSTARPNRVPDSPSPRPHLPGAAHPPPSEVS